MCQYVNTYMYIYACLYKCGRELEQWVCCCVYVHVCVPLYIYIHICIRQYISIFTFMYTYRYIHRYIMPA